LVPGQAERVDRVIDRDDRVLVGAQDALGSAERAAVNRTAIDRSRDPAASACTRCT